MAKGTCIVLEGEPRGKFLEGIIDDTSLPGTNMQLVSASADVSGRYHYKASAPGTDGKAVLIAILREDSLQGKTINDAYVAGTRCFMYVPANGEELNVRVGEVAGTGNTYAIGDRVMADAEDGVFIPETGTPEETPFELMETLTQVIGSTLAWVRYFG